MTVVISNDVPYVLPGSTTQKLNKLRKITSLPLNLLNGAGEKEVEAICYMILFRHLNHVQRGEAMKRFHSLSNRALMGALITRSLDTTFVNAQWGIWSLTNEELRQDINLHRKITKYASAIGISSSAIGAKDLTKKILARKQMGLKHWATLVIWGCILFNDNELSKAETEHNHRSTLNGSRLFK